MRKVLPTLVCFLTLSAATATEPARIWVDIENSGFVWAGYCDFCAPLPAEINATVLEEEGDIWVFRLPDDGRIYSCDLLFENSTYPTQNMLLVLLPGERIEIKGRLYDTHTEFTITGSEMLSAWAEHRMSYIELEKQLAENNYNEWDPGTGSGENAERAKKDRMLRSLIRERRLEFMKENPEHPLSAFYYLHTVEDDYITPFRMLGGRIMEGDYGRVLDHQYMFYKEIFKKMRMLGIGFDDL
ncbi:MAG: hypothetical protein LUD76_00240 [Alistipes sp.]|nr:hypothetical protein [Alistipes sp.]